jgi:hypothetical protein
MLGTSGWQGGGVTTWPAIGDVATRSRRLVTGNAVAWPRVKWGRRPAMLRRGRSGWRPAILRCS